MKILVIEDDDDIRRVLQISLSRLGGMDVVEASSGDEGLLAAVRETPHLIMLDVMMPNTDGPTTLGMLRANAATASIPVVFMTAKAMPNEVARLRSLGAAAVLTKPFDPAQLPSDVRTIARSLGLPA